MAVLKDQIVRMQHPKTGTSYVTGDHKPGGSFVQWTVDVGQATTFTVTEASKVLDTLRKAYHTPTFKAITCGPEGVSDAN